jgi:twinkle protein
VGIKSLTFIKTHQPCHHCGSSDGLAINDDMSTKCFVCNTFTPSTSHTEEIKMLAAAEEVDVKQDVSFLKKYREGMSVSVSDRRITKATMEKYGVVRCDDGLYFPYHDKDNQLVAAKVRGLKDKAFSTAGAWGKGTLFGQHLFPIGGRYLTLVEGEFDALAAYQMTGSKYPVVSIRNGAGSALKDCKQHYEYINSFENIIVCFDGDEHGVKAAKEVAELFGSKCKVFKPLPDYKDACDWLSDSKEASFVDRWWKAEQYVPDGIVNGKDLWDALRKPKQLPDATWPYSKLNEMMAGVRKRELITIAAGTGQGKSTFLRQLIHHLLITTNDNIGMAFLEESPERTALGIMSIEAGKPLHLPQTEHTEEELELAYLKTLGTGRCILFNHFGSLDIDNVLNRLRYMAKVQNCQWIILDHYQMILSGMDTDERKGLDMLLTKLRTFVEETGVGLFGVSHTRRQEGRGLENGAEISLSSLRGTQGISQLSDAVIGLQRDQQHNDEAKRNTTELRLLKSRFTGETGPAGVLYFDKALNKLVEVPEEFL